MLKKTLLSAAIASTFALSGCLDDTPKTNENAGAVTNPDLSTAVYPLFSPVEGALPIPNDLIYADAGDGSFEVGDTSPPVTTALNGLSGASTVAPIDIAMSGPIDPTTLVGQEDPANQNVFLIELEYATGEPLRGLQISEPPTIIPGNQKQYAVEHLTLDGTSYIRINPKEPLSPLKRYVVVVGTSITDAAGNPITQSPGAGGYEALTDPTTVLNGALTALQPVQSLIAFWESIAFSAIPTLANEDDNIALSYSFTTSGDEAVLGYIAEPNTWFTDQLSSFIKLATAETLIEGGSTDYTTINGAITATINAVPNIPINDDGVTLRQALDAYHVGGAFAAVGCTGSETGQAYLDCVGTFLAALPVANGGFADLLPNLSTTINMDSGTTVDLVNAAPAALVAALPIPATTFSVTSGTMTVPYYSGVPSGADASALKYSNWVADSTLATAINTVFGSLGLSLPQADPAVSTVVNYVFPFPEKQDDVIIPILAIYPNNVANMNAMIWQHGITGNRTNALGFGSAFVAGIAGTSPTALFAIDLPLHGLDDENDASFAFNTPVERHFGFQDAGPGLAPEAIDLSTGEGSGSMFINLENLLTSRDSIRQHALDLFTLRNSLHTATLDGSAALSTATFLTQTYADNAFYSGHSLGTIGGQVFTAAAESTATPVDDVITASFFTPAGGIVRFIENSPTFGPTVASGLAANGVTSDTSSYQTYLNVLQHALDSADPINFVDSFGSTPVHYVEAVGDTVIPNSVDTEEETLDTTLSNGVVLNGSISFLSGTEPLAVETGATTLTATASPLPTSVVRTRFLATAANHGTPSTADPISGFSEIVSQTVSFVASGGTALQVTDSDLLAP